MPIVNGEPTSSGVMTPEEASEVDSAMIITAAMVALANRGLPTDVQELLLRGDPARGVRPGALQAALDESLRIARTMDRMRARLKIYPR